MLYLFLIGFVNSSVDGGLRSAHGFFSLLFNVFNHFKKE